MDIDLNRIPIEPCGCPLTSSIGIDKLRHRKETEECKEQDDSDDTDSSIMTFTAEANIPACNRRWTERYQELVVYYKCCGNCSVPSQWSENPALAQWVKRQRYQLNMVFQSVCFPSLSSSVACTHLFLNGISNSIKCQRRKMRLFLTLGSPSKSNITTPERIEKFSQLGVVFNPRRHARGGTPSRASSLPDWRSLFLKNNRGRK